MSYFQVLYLLVISCHYSLLIRQRFEYSIIFIDSVRRAGTIAFDEGYILHKPIESTSNF